MRRRVSKKINQRIHTKKRAFERYGFELTTRDLKEISSLIQNSNHVRAIKLAKRTNRISLYKVHYKDVFIPVAYDHHRHAVASVLPIEVLKKYEERRIKQ